MYKEFDVNGGGEDIFFISFRITYQISYDYFLLDNAQAEECERDLKFSNGHPTTSQPYST